MGKTIISRGKRIVRALSSMLPLLRTEMRVGIGVDDHAIETKVEAQEAGHTVRPIVLAGVEIPSEFSVRANSDGDVLFHSVLNATLLASGLRDLGFQFPDEEGGQWTGLTSEKIAASVMDRIAEDGWRINNATAMITAGHPKLSSYIDEMRKNLAKALRLDIEADPSCVGIGAATGERLTRVSRGEGIHVDSVVTLRRIHRKGFKC